MASKQILNRNGVDRFRYFETHRYVENYRARLISGLLFQSGGFLEHLFLQIDISTMYVGVNE